MYKKQYVPDKEVDFKYLSEPLHYNKMPKPYKEINQKEYFEGLDEWYCDYSAFFQVMDKDAEDMFGESCRANVYCDFNEEEGWARARSSKTGEYKFFRVGCKHDWGLISNDSLTNTYKCKKCGTIITQSNGR